ncbi:MAG: hypothetical protein PVG45_05410 [Gammaproteobacteria bacterium]|jgi:hypothetical protein
MDNGKLRLWQYKKAMILETYSSDELTLDDIDQVLNSLHERAEPPFLIIVVRTGSYRLSVEAKNRLREEDKRLFKIAYVVKELRNMCHAVGASYSYLESKDVFICDSIESAYTALTGVA